MEDLRRLPACLLHLLLSKCQLQCAGVLYIRTDTGDDSVLRQVVIQTVNWNTCYNIDSSFMYYLKPNMMCAGTILGGKSSCNGDSGGPLVCKQGDRWFQYGIVNFRLADLCAGPNRPSVYASVVAYQSWIREKSGGLYISILVLKQQVQYLL